MRRSPTEKENEPGMIRRDMASLAKELAEARRVLNEAQEPDRTGLFTILTEALLVLVAGVLPSATCRPVG